MKKRFHFYIVVWILLLGLIFGSIWDYQINQTLYSPNNVFGLTLSSFGMIPEYGILAFFGALITIVCFYIGNEFVVRKFLPKEEEPQVEGVGE